MSYILGISALYHDSAACLIRDGEIVCAVQEERFTRKKNDSSFPFNSINFCLDFAKTNLRKVEAVVFYDKPFIKFERLLQTHVAMAPKGLSSFHMTMPTWIKEKLFFRDLLTKNLKKIEADFDEKKIKFSEHHLSHAASAFYPSPFEDAIVLTIDGVGEWTTTSICIGSKNNLKIEKEIHFPHSIGLLYSAFTYYIGFKVNSGEYKLMGLAPYGKSIYADKILESLIDIKADGTFRLDMSYFEYATGKKMINDRFVKLFGEKIRNPDEPIEQFHMDIAASIQYVTEELIIKLSQEIKKEYKHKNLCLAGGVALNCVANGKLVKKKIFENIWIQPAAGDAGGALGAALAYWHLEKKKKRIVKEADSMSGSYLGPHYSQEEIESELLKHGVVYETHSKEVMLEIAATELSKGKSIGWFQGRSEFGPRSLGSRSIIADPRSKTMQKQLNLKIKFRESFRPFAPAVLFEDLSEWFEIDQKSPYMLVVANVLSKRCFFNINDDEIFGIEKLKIPRSEIPAVTHVDYSARIQSVHKETNPIFHELLTHFKGITNCPVLVNTSFNIRGEPIVNSPIDAFKCFMSNELDLLVVGNSIIRKKDQICFHSDISEIVNSNIPIRKVENDIYQIGEKQSVALMVENFYTNNPFPNYQNEENIFDLVKKVNQNIFLKKFKETVGLNKKIIEVGSGTSQLSIFLANASNNHVIAFDPTLESLKLGSNFAKKANVKNCQFVNADLFSKPFKDNSFDIVWCSGVLHHTKDPFGGFQIISNWLKNDGIIVIGLYNRYGRLRTVFRQILFKLLFRGKFARRVVSLFDPILRGNISQEKRDAWFQDQYEHPIESLHTIDEVLNWFDQENIEFLNSIPSPDTTLTNFEGLFTKKEKRNHFDRLVQQIGMLFSNYGKEGGLFLVIGKKR